MMLFLILYMNCMFFGLNMLGDRWNWAWYCDD